MWEDKAAAKKWRKGTGEKEVRERTRVKSGLRRIKSLVFYAFVPRTAKKPVGTLTVSQPARPLTFRIHWATGSPEAAELRL